MREICKGPGEGEEGRGGRGRREGSVGTEKGNTDDSKIDEGQVN